MEDLNGFRVAVVASDGFEEAELTEPVKALRGAHAAVTVIGPKPGTIQGFRHFTKGVAVKVERTLEDLDADEFDAVMLPGGTMNADFLRRNENLGAFLREVNAAAKPIAAICHAPWELISAGIISNRKLTSYHTIQDDIRNAGGEWLDDAVVLDGNLVTSRQPSDLPEFNRAMITLFAESIRN